VRSVPNDIHYVRSMLEKDRGIFTACGEMLENLRSPSLKAVPCAGDLASVSLYALYPRKAGISAAAASLIKHLSTCLE
jgi:hypothetical protein